MAGLPSGCLFTAVADVRVFLSLLPLHDVVSFSQAWTESARACGESGALLDAIILFPLDDYLPPARVKRVARLIRLLGERRPHLDFDRVVRGAQVQLLLNKVLREHHGEYISARDVASSLIRLVPLELCRRNAPSEHLHQRICETTDFGFRAAEYNNWEVGVFLNTCLSIGPNPCFMIPRSWILWVCY